jgi:hypothetical protein
MGFRAVWLDASKKLPRACSIARKDGARTSPALTEEVKRKGEMGMTADLAGEEWDRGRGVGSTTNIWESNLEARSSHRRTKVPERHRIVENELNLVPRNGPWCKFPCNKILTDGTRKLSVSATTTTSLDHKNYAVGPKGFRDVSSCCSEAAGLHIQVAGDDC